MNRKISKFAGCLMLAVGMLTASCSNDESVEVGENHVGNISGIRVSTTGQWLTSKTRAAQQASLNPDSPILVFDDNVVYEKTIKNLLNMTDVQRQKFYAKIGFESASHILSKADKELDDIFDIEDSTTFSTKVAEYMQKYDGVFSFENEEDDDITPNLKFHNPQKALVANLDGLVVIGDSIVSVSEELGVKPVSQVQSQGPPSWTAVDFQKAPGCELKNKHGKYRSIIYIGYDKHTKWVIAYFRTYRKVLGFKKKKPTRHFANVTISYNNKVLASSGIKLDKGPTNQAIAPQNVILSVTPQPPYTNLEKLVDIKVEKFNSDYCRTPIGTTFTNVNIYAI